MLSKLAVRRLTKLADYMQALPKKAEAHFSMTRWFRRSGGHKIQDPSLALKNFDCGTVACAAGWACAIPAFKKAGLRMSTDKYGVDDIVFGEFRARGSHSNQFLSLRKFFDIDADAAKNLFNPLTDSPIKTPKQWAKHCRKFIKANT